MSGKSVYYLILAAFSFIGSQVLLRILVGDISGWPYLGLTAVLFLGIFVGVQFALLILAIPAAIVWSIIHPNRPPRIEHATQDGPYTDDFVHYFDELAQADSMCGATPPVDYSVYLDDVTCPACRKIMDADAQALTGSKA